MCSLAKLSIGSVLQPSKNLHIQNLFSTAHLKQVCLLSLAVLEGDRELRSHGSGRPQALSSPSPVHCSPVPSRKQMMSGSSFLICSICTGENVDGSNPLSWLCAGPCHHPVPPLKPRHSARKKISHPIAVALPLSPLELHRDLSPLNPFFVFPS